MIVCTFGERIKELIFDKKITPEILGSDLQIDWSLVYRWQRKEYTPNLTTLLKLSDYFEVTLEYLSGRTDVNQHTKHLSPVPFNGRLQELISKKSNSTFAFCKQYNIHFSTIQH